MSAITMHKQIRRIKGEMNSIKQQRRGLPKTKTQRKTENFQTNSFKTKSQKKSTKLFKTNTSRPRAISAAQETIRVMTIEMPWVINTFFDPILWGKDLLLGSSFPGELLTWG